MANFIKNASVPRKGIQRGAMISDSGSRLGAMSPDDYAKRLDGIDWSNHETKTKIKVTGKRQELPEAVKPHYKSVIV